MYIIIYTYFLFDFISECGCTNQSFGKCYFYQKCTLKCLLFSHFVKVAIKFGIQE